MSWFQNLFDARRKIAAWRTEYNGARPHNSLGYLTPNEYAAQNAKASYGKHPCPTTASFENTKKRVSNLPTAPAAGNEVEPTHRIIS